MEFPQSIRYALLKPDEFMRLSKHSHCLREEILNQPKNILACPMIIDEIQKIPLHLPEIHWFIENTDAYFMWFQRP